VNLNNLSYNFMFIFAFFAAITTCFFAFEVGVRPVTTIFIRTLISFALFAVVGYLLGSFLKEEIISSMAEEKEKAEKNGDETTDEELPPLVLSNEENETTTPENTENSEAATAEGTTVTDNTVNQPVNEQPVQSNIAENSADSSFDKVVIVNNDAD